MSAASKPGSVHTLWATTTRKVVTHAMPTFRIECTCGWQSGWNYDWRKSMAGHVYREQRKERHGL